MILNIETAANICSVALSKNNVVINSMDYQQSNAHSRMLSVLIDKVFENTYYSAGDLQAIAVSKGPGSYTGLRIGVSTAKGLAYAMDIPLIGVDTLEILACAARNKYPDCMYLPMIDARRMEVYSAVYDKNLNKIKEISADIIDSDIYSQYKADKIILVGDGAKKAKDILTDDRYVLDESILLNAKDMAPLAHIKLMNKDFEDVAYFEPYYLKEFIAVKSKVKGLYGKK